MRSESLRQIQSPIPHTLLIFQRRVALCPHHFVVKCLSFETETWWPLRQSISIQARFLCFRGSWVWVIVARLCELREAFRFPLWGLLTTCASLCRQKMKSWEIAKEELVRSNCGYGQVQGFFLCFVLVRGFGRSQLGETATILCID